MAIPMPVLRPGDWIDTGDALVRVVEVHNDGRVLAAAGSKLRLYQVATLRGGLCELRKSDGTVWRRDP